jgi:hypothetical protein
MDRSVHHLLFYANIGGWSRRKREQLAVGGF